MTLKQMMLIISVLLLPLLIVFAQPDSTAAGYIAGGDEAYARFDNEGALNYYRQAFELDSTGYQAAWKICRAYVDIGETLPDKDQRKEYYLDAEKFARKAIEIDSLGAKGHLWLSIALGRVALDAGAKKRVRMSKEIKKEVDRSLELDPNDDIAWHVLGRWHRKIATLSWIERKFANIFLGGVPKEASVEKAAECFRKAIEIHPEHINHYLELGLTCEKLKQKELAIRQYEKVLELPVKDADDEGFKKTARERLKKLKK
jgi:tetratricopeptide (TPR) repeat protein